jgi:hypothetical protein
MISIINSLKSSAESLYQQSGALLKWPTNVATVSTTAGTALQVLANTAPIPAKAVIMVSTIIVCSLSQSIEKQPKKIQDFINKCTIEPEHLVGTVLGLYIGIGACVLINPLAGTLLGSLCSYKITRILLDDERTLRIHLEEQSAQKKLADDDWVILDQV